MPNKQRADNRPCTLPPLIFRTIIGFKPDRLNHLKNTVLPVFIEVFGLFQREQNTVTCKELGFEKMLSRFECQQLVSRQIEFRKF
jgi:hypothetical protein